MEFLEWIDVPVTFGKMRRILRFKLDLEWLQSINKHTRKSDEISPRIKAFLESL